MVRNESISGENTGDLKKLPKHREFCFFELLIFGGETSRIG